MTTLLLPDAARGLRLDRAVYDALVAAEHEVSVREVRIALTEGRILVDGRQRAPGLRARGGETIGLQDFTPRQQAVVPADPELLARCEVLFDDARRLCLAKQSGVPSQPQRPGERNTMLGAAVAHTPSIGEAGPPLEGGLVHRLDIETSGALLFAKDLATRLSLRRAFAAGGVEKRYVALVWDPDNRLRAGRKIDAWIGRGSDPSRVAIRAPQTPEAQPALTEIVRLTRMSEAWAWVELVARTGRRHQVRIHLASLATPIAGDVLYGGPRAPNLTRLALHAEALTLPDRTTIHAPLAEDLARVRNELS
jgi:23S rRNA pseudouridine1911/1915/1917 synthase